MFLDPTNDVAFKRIFGNEANKDILISFLNNILDFKEQYRIFDIEFLDTHQTPKLNNLKDTILDVRCKDGRGISYIIEMQVAKPSNFEKRALYYTSKAYINQIEIGEDYPKLNQVIFVGIVDFEMFIGENYITNHLILNTETLKNEINDFRFCFIELPKFTKREEELITIADKWIYFLKNAKKLKIMPSNVVEKEIQEAYSILDRFNWTVEEYDYYERYGVALQDARGRIEQGFMDGMKKGKIEGIEEGIEKGKIQTAKKALQNGIDIKTIALITSLDKIFIEELAKEISEP
jgi:predicted transposase/invertase (TIGR01784 family)